jgi:hypothetical protein
MKLVKILDLEGVTPLFNVPSCVLFAIKGGNTSYPVLTTKYSGKLPLKNLGYNEAKHHLRTENYQYQPPEIPMKYSYYYEKVKRGAFMYPGSLWFVEFIEHPILGIDSSKPTLKTSKDAEKLSKTRWKGINLKENIECKFIYATFLSSDLVPFGYTKLRPVILPIEASTDHYALLDVDDLRRNGYPGMGNWLENAQRIWENRRTSKDEKLFPRLIDRLDYQGLLTTQNPSSKYLVIYNAHGTNIASCVVEK